MGVQRLSLTNGDWLDVKEGLTVLDKRHVFDHAFDHVTSDGDYKFNPVAHSAATAAVRIVNWQVNGQKPWPAASPTSFKQRVAVIEALEADLFEPLSTAIDAFETELKAKKEAAKNATPADASA